MKVLFKSKVEKDISLSNYKRQSETSYIQEEMTYFCQTLKLFKLTLEDIINTSLNIRMQGEMQWKLHPLSSMKKN